MIWPTFGSIFWFLNPGIQTSRNPGIPWIWCGLADFNIWGVFPTQILSRNLIFNTKFKNSFIPGIFQELPGTLECLWNWQVFLPNLTYWVSIQLNFCHWKRIWPKNWEKYFLGILDTFLDLGSKKISRLPKRLHFLKFLLKFIFSSKN